jgi:hypothetical protein
MNRKMQIESRRVEYNDPKLEIVDVKNDAPVEAKDANGLKATLLGLNDGAFAALTSAAWCGGGGASGFDDMPRLFRCPSYGQV